MKNKKTAISFLILIILLIFSLFGSGCAKRGNTEPDYSKAIADDFLIAVSASDYDFISTVLSENFKENLKSMIDPETQQKYTNEEDAFIEKISKPIVEKIGQYEKGSLTFIKSLTEKGHTSVFYETKFSKETQGPVTVQFVFEESDGKMLVGGLWFSSKTLQQ